MTEFLSVRVHAIVLRHRDWGETDRLVTLFTREQGKTRTVVKVLQASPDIIFLIV